MIIHVKDHIINGELNFSSLWHTFLYKSKYKETKQKDGSILVERKPMEFK